MWLYNYIRTYYGEEDTAIATTTQWGVQKDERKNRLKAISLTIAWITVVFFRLFNYCCYKLLENTITWHEHRLQKTFGVHHSFVEKPNMFMHYAAFIFAQRHHFHHQLWISGDCQRCTQARSQHKFWRKFKAKATNYRSWELWKQWIHWNIAKEVAHQITTLCTFAVRHLFSDPLFWLQRWVWH